MGCSAAPCCECAPHEHGMAVTALTASAEKLSMLGSSLALGHQGQDWTVKSPERLCTSLCVLSELQVHRWRKPAVYLSGQALQCPGA